MDNMEALLGAVGGPSGAPQMGGPSEPSPEELMAMLQALGDDPNSAPPELADLMKEVRAGRGQATAADKHAQGQDIVPEPGFVIKSQDQSGNKVFINICGSDKVSPPGAKWENGQVPKEVQKALDQGDEVDETGQAALRCPISLGEPRVDMDRKGEACTVFDCVFNDEVCGTASKGHRQLKNFIIELAMGWIQHKHKMVLDPKYKLPRMKYKGEQVTPMRIRMDKKPLVTEVQEDKLEEPDFPLVTKPIPATVARPPKAAKPSSSADQAAEPSGVTTAPAAKASTCGGNRLEHALDFPGCPAQAAEVTVRVPEGGPPLDPKGLQVEVMAESVSISCRGYPGLQVKLPFFVTANGCEGIVSDSGKKLCVTLPFRPFASVLEEMQADAPHRFGDLQLNSDAYLDLEP